MNLRIIEIRDAGGADERVFMKAIENCNLANYLLYDETYDDEGNISNLMPHMYRFPALAVKKGEYVSFRTQGADKKYKKGTLDDNETVCHYLYWGLERTVFNQGSDKVHLILISEEQSKQNRNNRS